MKRLFNASIMMSLIFITSSCKNNSKKYSFTVKGTLSNSNNEWVMISQLTPETSTLIDSVKLDDSGRFELKIKANQSPELFLLKVKDYPERITLLLEDDEVVDISGDALYLNKTYIVSGSKGSENIRNLNKGIKHFMSQADSVFFAYRSQKVKEDTIKPMQIDSIMDSYFKKVHDFVADFCIQNKDNLASIIGLYSKYGDNLILDSKLDKEVFKTIGQAIFAKYPENTHAININKIVEELLQEEKRLAEVETTLNAGQPAPNLILNNPTGEKMDLSTFKGKNVILYFWYATNKDCWDVNKELKTIYRDYKDKDLEILSVSMDHDKLQWANTIALDNLAWKNVIADENTSKIYNIKDQPRLFLINSNGLIEAKDISIDSVKTYLQNQINIEANGK